MYKMTAVVSLLVSFASGFLIFKSESARLRLNMPSVMSLEEQACDRECRLKIHVNNPCPFPVEILQVSTSCTCTAVQVSNKLIYPKKSAELTVVVDTTSRGKDADISVSYHRVGGGQVFSQPIHIVGLRQPVNESKEPEPTLANRVRK